VLIEESAARRYLLKFESPKSEKLSLFQHGERAYDHVIIFPPTSKAYGPNLTPNIILDYIKAEGNVLLALSGASPTPSAINSLLLELDIHLPPERNAVVVDHFNYDAGHAEDKHDVLLVQAPKTLRPGTKNYFPGKAPIAVPRAVGQVLGNESPLLAPILRAPSTAYSYNTKDDAEGLEEVFASGEQLSLASAMQARNSARFTVLGSVEMLEDTWFDAKVKDQGQTTATGNRAFARQLTEWTFKEVGVLKVGRMFDYLNEGSIASNSSKTNFPEVNPKIYRIKNDVVSLVGPCSVMLLR
jgi:oligosaccharyltransferase complex subunit beta